MKEPKLFVATKALIHFQGKILILRESNRYSNGTNVGLFDVVGGRMEPGEPFDICLKREVKEETGLDVEIGSPFFVREWRLVVKEEPWQVVGIFFECFTEDDRILPGEDHSEHKWIDPKHFREESLIPNLHPVFEAYLAKQQT